MHVALRRPGWHGAKLRWAGPDAQCRFLANNSDDPPEKRETLPPAVANPDDTTVVAEQDASVPAVGSSSDLSAGTTTDAAIVTHKKKMESIDDILIRTHRKELVQRHGPHIERYMPSEDPTAFLLPDSRLQPEERKWQKIFTALPWAVFACMLATPLLLVGMNLPWLQKRAEAFRQAREAREDDEVPTHLPGFVVVNFGQMPDVLERPFPTMLMIFDPSTFASMIFLPVLRELSELLRAAGIAVSVAALDVSASPQPSHDFLWEYPPALAPHLQLVIPRMQDGEAGVVDYDGSWNVVALADVARRLAGPYGPAVPPEELARVQSQVERLRDLLFEVVFLSGSTASSGQAPQHDQKASWLGRLFGAAPRKPTITVTDKSKDLECNVDFSGDVAVAVRSCEDTLRVAQAEANSKKA